jgi:hypothetical protein
VHSKKQAAFEVDFEKGRVRRFHRESKRDQCDVLGDLEMVGLEAEKINALALRPVYVPT